MPSSGILTTTRTERPSQTWGERMPTSEDDKKTGAVASAWPEVEEPKCEWVDRHTVRYVREWQHSVERVWRAVTEADEVARWFIGPVEIDLRLGGAYKFGG